MLGMEVQLEVQFLVSIVMLSIVGVVLRLHHSLIAKPEKLRSMLREQGINGPTPTLLLGNVKEMKKTLSATLKDQTNRPPLTHNCSALLFPFLEQWRKQYGENFAFSVGNTQIMYAKEAELVKEMSTCTSLDLGKPTYQHKAFGPLLGRGILTSNGSLWSHHRKLLAPQLYMDKVKRMTSLITESAVALVNSWKQRIETEGGVADIKIDEGMRSFSGDVISRACFGSNYSNGEQIFLKLRALQEAMSKNRLFTGIPGIRYFPTKNNREAWKLEKEIKQLILQVVKERQEAAHEADLLQMVLESAKDSNLSKEETDRFIVDNCKNIYLAGFETTAVAASWILMLLAVNQEWQDQVRTEILELCGTHFPISDSLRKMKQLTMVIYESLRLYPPVSVISREVFNDTRFGNINIPKGVNIWILATTLHIDPEIWGPDSYNFNPNRFSNGVTGACKFPNLYMPFGVGPRICLGQNLAMVELKILISMIISNFSFSLSPNYVHSPALRLVIEPEFGVDLLIRKL